ncbi:MAG TPA: GNAT family N-acetyltransferase [Gemmatimonadales bacterium]|nr:GNAT family N-acetyltransferase [Gemmatimonadales bacterium]
MRAWLPERTVTGPIPVTVQDVRELNHLFAESFTDRYRRDGLVGVRVPELNPKVWEYALLDAGHGAMLWRDEAGAIAAFNVAHRCGSEGWMGPLAVRIDRQGTGLGKTIVRTAVDWLIDQGATTVGLETMPRTVENIGFYARLGFVPGHLTVTMSQDIAVRRRGQPVPALLSTQAAADQERSVAAVRGLVSTLGPGCDFTREILLTAEVGLGDTVLVSDGGELTAMVLWHTASLAADRGSDELRVLKLAARDASAFEAAVTAVERSAASLGLRRVAVRCQTGYPGAFRALVARGYQVRWTDLRMSLDGYPERLAARGVLFSNWEI